METLPYEVQCLIMSYAHPIHPCKVQLETRLHGMPAWWLWLKGVEWDSMSDSTKEWLYDGLDDTSYNYFD